MTPLLVYIDRCTGQVMRELQKYSHHVTLFTQMCQRLVSIYARDATDGVQQLAGELSGRYAGLTSSAAARAKTLQVKCKDLEKVSSLNIVFREISATPNSLGFAGEPQPV